MRYVFAAILCTFGMARAADVVEQLPSSTRLLVGINLKQLIDSPLGKQQAERLSKVFSDWSAALVNLGLEPTTIDRIWLTAGDGYPRGTAIFFTGKIDPAKVEFKMQQHIREHRFAVRPFRENNQPCYALETPVGMNPIPGMPSNLFVTMRKQDLVVTFDQETLLLLLRPIEQSKSAKDRFAPHTEALDRQSGLVGAFRPPEVLTVSGSLLVGVASVEVEADLEKGLIATLTFRCADAATFQTRLKDGLEQAKQVFAPLATQQAVDPKLMQFLQELLTSAKIELKYNDVTLSTEITADMAARILKK